MSPGLRKFALTAHVVSSVGWLGAVAVSLALAIAGVISPDAQVGRAAFITLELIGWWVLVPFSTASLLTGLVMSLGTTWGLFRHYWVLIKFVINVFANIILLMYMQTLSHLARVPQEVILTRSDVEGYANLSPAVHAGAALIFLLVATALSIYKPKGMTPYGRSKNLSGGTS